MPMPLMDQLDVIAGQLRVAHRVFLLSDFDGTLVPIMEHPDECYLDQQHRLTLAALARLAGFTVGIVSGRELLDLRSRIGLDEIVFVGNHGFEIAGPGFTFDEPRAEHLIPQIDAIASLLESSLDDVPGVWIENKGLTASLHYRQMEPAAIPALIETANRLLAPYLQARQIVLRHGKMTLEVRPGVDWNKAKAIAWLIGKRQPTAREPLLIFFGDDETDNDVFQAWPQAITVSVGDPHTAARYFVPDHHAVHAFMRWLL